MRVSYDSLLFLWEMGKILIRTFQSLMNFGSSLVSEDRGQERGRFLHMVSSVLFTGTTCRMFESQRIQDHLEVISSQRCKTDCEPVPGLTAGDAEMERAQALPPRRPCPSCHNQDPWLSQQPPISSLSALLSPFPSSVHWPQAREISEMQTQFSYSQDKHQNPQQNLQHPPQLTLSSILGYSTTHSSSSGSAHAVASTLSALALPIQSLCIYSNVTFLGRIFLAPLDPSSL